MNRNRQKHHLSVNTRPKPRTYFDILVLIQRAEDQVEEAAEISDTRTQPNLLRHKNTSGVVTNCRTSELTGHAKLNGNTILALSLLALCKEKVFPPSTGVEAVPKLQGPAEETFSWYSFRHTRK